MGSPAPRCHWTPLRLGEHQVRESRRLSLHTAPTSVLLHELRQQLCELSQQQICSFPPAQSQLPLNGVWSARAGKRAQGTAGARGTLHITITQPRREEITRTSTSRRVTFSVCPLLPVHSYRCKQARSLRGQDHPSQGLTSSLPRLFAAPPLSALLGVVPANPLVPKRRPTRRSFRRSL